MYLHILHILYRYRFSYTATNSISNTCERCRLLWVCWRTSFEWFPAHNIVVYCMPAAIPHRIHSFSSQKVSADCICVFDCIRILYYDLWHECSHIFIRTYMNVYWWGFWLVSWHLCHPQDNTSGQFPSGILTIFEWRIWGFHGQPPLVIHSVFPLRHTLRHHLQIVFCS